MICIYDLLQTLFESDMTDAVVGLLVRQKRALRLRFRDLSKDDAEIIFVFLVLRVVLDA